MSQAVRSIQKTLHAQYEEILEKTSKGDIQVRPIDKEEDEDLAQITAPVKYGYRLHNVSSIKEMLKHLPESFFISEYTAISSAVYKAGTCDLGIYLFLILSPQRNVIGVVAIDVFIEKFSSAILPFYKASGASGDLNHMFRERLSVLKEKAELFKIIRQKSNNE